MYATISCFQLGTGKYKKKITVTTNIGVGYK